MSDATTDSPATILVLDSGVGGLSVCKHIIAQLPSARLHYLSDNAAFPYGERSPEYLRQRSLAIVQAFAEKTSIDAVVIACNTASTVCLPTLREHFAMPFIGVVPAIKPAAKISRSQCFALLATPGTAERDYTLELIKEFAAEQRVIRIGSAELVELIENTMLNGQLDQQRLRDCLAPLLEHSDADKIDTVVLGCTHFPLIETELRQLQPNWQWLESGPAIAAQLQRVLESKLLSRTTLSRTTLSRTRPNNNAAAPHQFWITSRQQGPDYLGSKPLGKFIASMGFSAELALLTMTND